MQNNKLTAACGQSLSTWIRKSHKNLCFLLVGGNRNVSTVHHLRCQEFTARNRQQRYAAMDAADSPRTPDNMKKKRWPLIPLGCNELPIKKKNSQDASTPQKPPTVAPEMSDASSVTTDNDNGIEQKAPVAPERSDASSVATDNDNGIEQKAPVAPERSDASSVATDNGNNIDAVDTNTSASQQSTATASDMWTATAPDTDMWTLNESYDPKRPSPINCSTPSQTPSASSEALTTPSVGRTPSTSKGNRRSARVSLLLSTPLVSTDEFVSNLLAGVYFSLLYDCAGPPTVAADLDFIRPSRCNCYAHVCIGLKTRSPLTVWSSNMRGSCCAAHCDNQERRST